MSEAMSEEVGDDVYSDIEVNFIKTVARKNGKGDIIGTEV